MSGEFQIPKDCKEVTPVIETLLLFSYKDLLFSCKDVAFASPVPPCTVSGITPFTQGGLQLIPGKICPPVLPKNCA